MPLTVYLWLFHINTVADYARAVNVILSVVLLGVMLGSWRRFFAAARASQMLRISMLAFTIFALIASWETLVDDDPAPGVRSFILTAALSWALWAVWLDRRDNP